MGFVWEPPSLHPTTVSESLKFLSSFSLGKYREGLDALHLAREASVLMTPSLAAKQFHGTPKSHPSDKSEQTVLKWYA